MKPTCVAVLLLAAFLASSASAKTIELILDASGSMNAKLPSGETRIAAAKTAVGKVVAGLPKDTELAFRAYGHQSPREKHDCSDTQLLVPFGAAGANGAQVDAGAKGLTARGYTPITRVLELAAKDFIAAGKKGEKAIVLVSDGKETCDGDPCATAAALAAADVGALDPCDRLRGRPGGQAAAAMHRQGSPRHLHRRRRRRPAGGRAPAGGGRQDGNGGADGQGARQPPGQRRRPHRPRDQRRRHRQGGRRDQLDHRHRQAAAGPLPRGFRQRLVEKRQRRKQEADRARAGHPRGGERRNQWTPGARQRNRRPDRRDQRDQEPGDPPARGLRPHLRQAGVALGQDRRRQEDPAAPRPPQGRRSLASAATRSRPRPAPKPARFRTWPPRLPLPPGDYTVEIGGKAVPFKLAEGQTVTLSAK